MIKRAEAKANDFGPLANLFFFSLLSGYRWRGGVRGRIKGWRKGGAEMQRWERCKTPPHTSQRGLGSDGRWPLKHAHLLASSQN